MVFPKHLAFFLEQNRKKSCAISSWFCAFLLSESACFSAELLVGVMIGKGITEDQYMCCYFVLISCLIQVLENHREEIRAIYLSQHPIAFWVDFGDFQFLRIEPKVVQYVSGVATALLGLGEFSREEFSKAIVDPIYQFSKPITSRMNKDHTEDTKLIVQHSTSVPVNFAEMLDVDSLGFNVKIYI